MLNMYCFHIVFFSWKMLQNEKFRNSMKDLWFVEREVVRAQAIQWRAYAKEQLES